MSTKRVVIVQRRMTHYRLPLFEQLREELGARDVKLDVLVGEATKLESRKIDGGILSWAKPLKTYYLADNKLCFLPIGEHLRDADLVVITQENQLLYNHWLMIRPRRFRLAFWGHGANLQSNNPNSLRERYKRWTTKQVDWWFAYTQMSADLVISAGFPEKRITVLNNAVDTSELHRLKKSLTSDDIQAVRSSLGIGSGPVGIFLGSLHTDKKLDFLFDAAEIIHTKIPDFNLILVGDGPERERVKAWCSGKPWTHWVGARFGREKVAHLATAQILLNPGMVGLSILDSFVCGVPMLTTDCGLHSPEIEYLKPDINGLMTPLNSIAYANACENVLRDSNFLHHLQEGCQTSATQYTLKNMASNFSKGIMNALELKKKQ